jgi:predicted Zn-dependent protease
MGKITLQILVVVGIFLGIWFVFSQIDFVKMLHLNKISKRMEDKIGEVIMETIEKTNKIGKRDEGGEILDKIKERLCEGAAINKRDIHVHLVESSEINAFALPGNHLVVYTGLIKRCDSVSELCGVMAHEIGHLQLKHVMKRLAGKMGITVLASVVTNGNSEVVGNIIELLSSSAFERKQEAEADAFAVDCLHRAHINQEGFSNFMLKIAEIHSAVPEVMEWISSHPDSRKRAEEIRTLASKKGATKHTEVISEADWQELKDAAANLN